MTGAAADQAVRSFLEIYDLETRAATTVLAADARIEAPNWMPDGGSLIVNMGGALFQVELTDPVLRRIDTGGCVLLNNDHAPSPDGRTFAISDKTETGKSCIYTLSAAGGTPRRVTPKVPSWFHAWSPDGQRIAYTAVRSGDFCIATCGVDGTDERVLITGPHHYDGPDYTPDGAYIWFNSDRGGNMQLWRMKIDGTDVEQMTNDDRVNWFAHPSPQGDQVLFLSYPPGTQGHPADLTVELRMYNMVTGRIETLKQLFGGQGTLNVPSWAPDGRRFAYLRYAL